MKSLFAATAALALITIAAPASAEVYGSLGYTSVDTGAADVGGVTGRLGWKPGGYFGLEGELNVGTSDDTVAGTTTDLKHQYAGYVTGTLPIGANFELIGRIGYGQTKVESTTAAITTEDKVDSVNYGVGAQYNWGANGIRADYTRHEFQGTAGGDADAMALSFVRRF